LSRAVETGRLSHAYLFEGPDGVGKSMTALALARMLLCPEKGACDVCDTCARILEGRHTSIKTYSPLKGKRNIGVDVIRDDLIPFFTLKNAEGDYKITIVNPVDALSEDAANMLLKTLEEPIKWSLLVLLTVSSKGLLPTIVSRCHRVRFNRIPSRLIADKLIEKMEISPEHAATIARLSDGSLGRAIELAGRDFLGWRVKILDSFAGLLRGDSDPHDAAGQFLEIAGKSTKELQEKRVELKRILDMLLTYMRDLLITGERLGEPLLNDDRATIVQESEMIDNEEIFRILDRIFEAKNDIEKNVNLQLAIEELCIDTREIAGAGSI